MKLLPFQKDASVSSVECLISRYNTIFVAPTGAGKTVIFCDIITKWLLIAGNENKKVCVMSHRSEITRQNKATFEKLSPHISTSLFGAKIKDWSGQVVFAMAPTLSRKSNLKSMP